MKTLQKSENILSIPSFTGQSNLLVGRGAHPALYPNCKCLNFLSNFHCKFRYPQPYQSKVWKYKRLNPEIIKTS